jgi:general secretion pathway protein D
MNNKTIAAQAGTQSPFISAPTTANPTGFFPLGTQIPGGGSTSEGLLTSGLRHLASGNSTPEVATITGVLTDPQFRVIIRALEQRTGVDLLSAPRVTTLSGRQAQVSVQDSVSIVSAVTITTATAGGGATAGGLATAGGVNTPSINYTVQALPFGPNLDVVPYVSADGYSIQMTIIPTLTEFVQYDDPGSFVPQSQSAAGSTIGIPLRATLPLPRLRVRQVTTSCIVWDGQTVVLGGLISEDIQKIRDKVPVLGDIPLLGRLFRSESSFTKKKNLMVFVTPSIIDPAGNRVHSDDELPFARTSIPPQTPVQ